MTQEEKELLIKDLSARLQYGVKIYLDDFPNATLVGVVNGGIILHCDKHDYIYDTPWNIGYIKPYLRPLSSMNKEELREYNYLYAERENNNEWDDIEQYSDLIDWLNKNHFDYRGLIEKGLAIDATDKNIY